MKNKKNQKRWWKALDLLAIVIGIVILICNLFKIAPGFDNWFYTFVTIIIAGGFFIGGALILIGGSDFLDNYCSNDFFINRFIDFVMDFLPIIQYEDEDEYEYEE